MSRQLAELLLKDKVISPAQFAEAEAAAKTGKSYVRHLIEKKHVAEPKLLYYLSQKFGLPSINLSKFEISQQVIALVAPDIAKKSQVVPIQASNGNVVVAMCDPSNSSVLENLKFLLKMNVEAVLTTYSAFDAAIAKYYGGAAYVGAAIESFKKSEKQKSDKEGETSVALELVQVHDIEEGANPADAPVITLVNGILSEAIRRGASDIHLEPYEHRVRVRFRIDGVLYEVAEIPKEMKRAVTARFKVMSRMDISETRVPQDGRIKLKSGSKDIDFRVNSLPTLFGEKVVLRMLNKGNLNLDMMKLGFESRQLEFHVGWQRSM